MRLGLVITSTGGGAGRVLGINEESSWSHSMSDDLRTPLNGLDHFDGSGKSVFFVQFFGNNGYVIALIKSRPEGSGRPGDNTTAFIHFPVSCDFSGKETESILKSVETAISGRNGIDEDQLEEIFNKDYTDPDPDSPVISATSALVSDPSGRYALRYYNEDYTLKELLGKEIAQREYGKYKGIFLVDKDLGVKAIGIDELTSGVKKIVRVESPGVSEGFRPFLKLSEGERPFEVAIELPETSEVKVVWRRSGYRDVQKSPTAADVATNPESLNVLPTEVIKVIKKSDFPVFSEKDDTPIQSFEVFVNDDQICDEKGFPEQVYRDEKGVRLVVTANEYEVFKDSKYRLAEMKKIRLEKKKHHYIFDLTTVQGIDCRLSIVSEKQLRRSPLKGYKVDGKEPVEDTTNVLICAQGMFYEFKYILIGLFAGLFIAVGVIVGAYLLSGSAKDQPDKESQTTKVESPLPAPKTPEVDHAKEASSVDSLTKSVPGQSSEDRHDNNDQSSSTE